MKQAFSTSWYTRQRANLTEVLVPTCSLVRCRQLAEELDTGSVKSEAVRAALSREGTSLDAALYVLLRAADRFALTRQRAPGAQATDCEADMPALKALAVGILAEASAQVHTAAITDDLLGALSCGL